MKVDRKALRKIIREQLEIMVDDHVEDVGMPHGIYHADTEEEVPKSGSDEIGMTVNQLQAAAATAMELAELVKMMNYVPEWGQAKVATVLDRLNSLKTYMVGKQIGQED